MTSRNLSTAPRIIAPGGPVTRAVAAGRGEIERVVRARHEAIRDRVLSAPGLVEALRTVRGAA